MKEEVLMAAIKSLPVEMREGLLTRYWQLIDELIDEAVQFKDEEYEK
jgi:hypothetical protein